MMDLQKRLDEFKRDQAEKIGLITDALDERATTGRLPRDPEIQEIVGEKMDARPNREPNDFAIEQLARMVVRDSRHLAGAGWRVDAGETRLFSRMLKHIVAMTVPTLYEPNQVRMAFPVDNSFPAGARTATYHRILDHDDGRLGNIAEMGDDVLMVDIGAEEINYNIATYARGFRWSIDELEAAAFARVSLNTEKLSALNRAVERVFETVSLQGDSAKNIAGLYNDANITLTGPTTGTWSTASWAEILADCKKLLDAVKVATGDNYTPNRLLIPASLWTYMTLRRTNTDLNIMQALMNDYPGLQIMEISKADLYDAAGTGPRIMAFSYNPDLLKVAEPMRFSLEPPEKHGFNYRVVGRQKLAGAVIPVPLSAGYMDGC